jgi:hypothetical protein
MNALKRVIVLGAVFFIGFSFVAFGKITYQDTTNEIRISLTTPTEKLLKQFWNPSFAKVELGYLFNLFLKTWVNILNGTVQQTPLISGIRDQIAKRLNPKKVKTRLLLIIQILEQNIIQVSVAI